MIFAFWEKIDSVTKLTHELKLKMKQLVSILISNNLLIYKPNYKQIVRNSNNIHFNNLFNIIDSFSNRRSII